MGVKENNIPFVLDRVPHEPVHPSPWSRPLVHQGGVFLSRHLSSLPQAYHLSGPRPEKVSNRSTEWDTRSQRSRHCTLGSKIMK